MQNDRLSEAIAAGWIDCYIQGGSFSWEKCPVCGAGGDTGYGRMLFYQLRS